MNSELSILTLIAEASFVVQVVMFLLLLASVVSWTFIFSKYKEIRRAKETSEHFEERFWSGIDLADLYRELVREDYETEGLENIFKAGFKEFVRLKQQPNMAPDAVIEGTQRAMRVVLNRELERLDERLPFLATVGSTSPYIGLFGTVWGIMNSFRSLGSVKQATLAMVAPGISEALVATAMGLFAAIPAVMAYNRYATDIGRLASRYEAFTEEFLSLLHRQAHVPHPAPSTPRRAAATPVDAPSFEEDA
jgi:biopolymer transport protein TolQ